LELLGDMTLPEVLDPSPKGRSRVIGDMTISTSVVRALSKVQREGADLFINYAGTFVEGLHSIT